MRLLDRLRGAPMVQPLHGRDYRLLTFGAIVSLLGDGFFFVALAWQVYEISNEPTALAAVGIAGTLPTVFLLLVGGAFSDRYDRRRILIGADLVRAAALAVMAVLSLSGSIQLWHVVVLQAFVGIGNSFFNPASSAIVPDLVIAEHLPAANALSGTYRPLTARLLGPALAGFVVAGFGPGIAFAVDAGSFIVSALAVAAIAARPPARAAQGVTAGTMVHEVVEGLRYVRGQPWIWATLLSAMLSLLVFIGPEEVLVPFIIKNRLGLGADALGSIFAAGGVGSVVMALLVGQLGQPRRRITVMFASWSLAVAGLAVFGLMTELWQGLVAGAISAALFELGQLIWMTLLQQRVPRELLGRVSSLDWLVSTGLVPLSFALTGPVSDVFGPDRTLIGAALIGAVFMGMLLFVPGVRDPEHERAAP